MTETNAETPWVRGHLRIARGVFEAVERDALERYAADEEACGYLVGPAEDALACDEIVAMPNLANKLHALDPETYFRTGRMYFAFNEKKFDDAVRKGAAAGRPVKVLYHSHLDAGAYFSATDKAVMSLGEPPAKEGDAAVIGAGPAWALAYLVTSVVKGEGDAAPRVAETRLFVWDPGARDFVAAPFDVVG